MSDATNHALVFVKPHAHTDSVKALVTRALEKAKIKVLKDGVVEAAQIDKDKIIDKHYATIARYAMEWSADKITLDDATKAKFKETFEQDWDAAVKDGTVLNAVEAAKKLGDLNAEDFGKKWDGGKRMKLAPGLYVVHLADDKLFTLNGFYLRNRQKFVADGKKVAWYTVQWNEADLTWADFRAKVVGPTDPTAAGEESIRGTILREWKSLGLEDVPNMGDNGVHASAGPLEGLAERIVWLGNKVEEDPFGKALVDAGVAQAKIEELVGNPVTTLEGKTAPVFDLLEDRQTSDVVKVLGAGGDAAPAAAAPAAASSGEAILYYAPISQPSRAVRWFIEHQKITGVKQQTVDLFKGATFTPEYTKKNIYQSVPCLELPDGNVICESGAIMTYLARTQDKKDVWPAEDAIIERMRVEEALIKHEGLARPTTMLICRKAVPQLFDPESTIEKCKEVIAKDNEDLKWYFSTLDKVFEKTKYIAGDKFSVADYLVASELNQLPHFPDFTSEDLHLEKFPNIQRYLKDVKEIPGHDEFEKEAIQFGTMCKAGGAPFAQKKE